MISATRETAGGTIKNRDQTQTVVPAAIPNNGSEALQ